MHCCDNYTKAAKFYRALIGGRQHVEPQLQVVDVLLSHCAVKDPRILDMACGTGEVMDVLCENGRDVYGTDGSPQMFALAEQLPRIKREHRLLGVYKWGELDRLLQDQGIKRFDLVFALGHSLPHATEEEVRRFLTHAYNLLNEGGILAFDMRAWERNGSGQLVEPNRTARARRWLGEFTTDEGRRCWIDDVCEYREGRQRITYLVQYLDEGIGSSDCFYFEYTIFGCDEVKQWIVESPFVKPVEILSPQDTKSSYAVVMVRK